MTYTILSAEYRNAEQTAAVIKTVENGDVLIGQRDTPEAWQAMLAWGTPVEYKLPPVPVPYEIGRAQAKIVLHRIGKLSAIESFVSGSSDVELKLWWTEANFFRRDNAYINALAPQFSLSDADLDNLFIEADALG